MSRQPGEPYTIRRATKADANGMARVHVESWEAAYTGLIPDAARRQFDLPRRAIQWQRLLDGGAQAWVATEDELVIGFVEARGPEIPVLYLHPGWWRLGIGRSLLITALRAIRMAGHDRAWLWVLQDNEPAKAFYARLGGVPGEVRPVQVGDVILTEMKYSWPLRVRTN